MHPKFACVINLNVFSNVSKPQGVKEVMAATGTVVKVAQRGEYIPGTENRNVTITGTYASVQAAQNYIAQKLTHETLKVAYY